jgi:hypothetical protein
MAMVDRRSKKGTRETRERRRGGDGETRRKIFSIAAYCL